MGLQLERPDTGAKGGDSLYLPNKQPNNDTFSSSLFRLSEIWQRNTASETAFSLPAVGFVCLFALFVRGFETCVLSILAAPGRTGLI